MACLGDAGVLCVFILIGVAPNAKQVFQVRLVEWVTHIAVILEPRKKVAAHQEVQAFENDLCGLLLAGRQCQLAAAEVMAQGTAAAALRARQPPSQPLWGCECCRTKQDRAARAMPETPSLLASSSSSSKRQARRVQAQGLQSAAAPRILRSAASLQLRPQKRAPLLRSDPLICHRLEAWLPLLRPRPGYGQRHRPPSLCAAKRGAIAIPSDDGAIRPSSA